MANSIAQEEESMGLPPGREATAKPADFRPPNVALTRPPVPLRGVAPKAIITSKLGSRFPVATRST